MRDRIFEDDLFKIPNEEWELDNGKSYSKSVHQESVWKDGKRTTKTKTVERKPDGTVHEVVNEHIEDDKGHKEDKELLNKTYKDQKELKN